MDTEVAEAARATLAGTMPFPEVVRPLVETGVEYYHVDYVALRKTFYSAGGEVVTTPIRYEGLPTVVAEFDAAGLKTAILDSQRNGQSYRDLAGGRCRLGCRGIWRFCEGSG